MQTAGQFAVYCDGTIQDLYPTQYRAEMAIILAIREEPEMADALTWAELGREWHERQPRLWCGETRSRCPSCQGLFRLTKKDTLRRHNLPWAADAGEARVCPGSGRRPENGDPI